MKEVDIRPERECKYTKFFHSAQTGRKNIVSGRDLSLSLRKTGAIRTERGRAERGTALVKRRAAWIQRGRLGHNRVGLSKRRAGFGKQGAACITGGALRTQRDGLDATGWHGHNGTEWTTRCATDKTRCATDKIGNKFSFCRPPFTIFAGRQTPDRQVECRENFVRIRI